MPDAQDSLGVPRPRADQVGTGAGPTTALVARRVLVTGARGFIGRHLLRHLLDEQADVHAVVRPGTRAAIGRVGLPTRGCVTWHEGDLADPSDAERVIRASDPEIVFHLASEVAGHRDPALVSSMLQNNLRAATNVMTSAHRLGNRRVILAGSAEEPHDAGEAPCSPYAAAKLAATNYALLFHEQWDLPVTVLRPAMVYGPDQPDERKLIPHVITSMLDGRAPSLSSGQRLIDWVFIDDVCRAFLAAGTHRAAAGLVADIGSGSATSIADTVQRLALLTGYDGPLGFGSQDDRRHDTARIADLTTAARELDWHPESSLHVGLSRTVHWYLARRDPNRCVHETGDHEPQGGPGLLVVEPPPR